MVAVDYDNLGLVRGRFQHYRRSTFDAVRRPIIEKEATYIEYTNSYRFMLHDGVWSIREVTDATQRIKDAERTMNKCGFAPDNDG